MRSPGAPSSGFFIFFFPMVLGSNLGCQAGLHHGAALDGLQLEGKSGGDLRVRGEGSPTGCYPGPLPGRRSRLSSPSGVQISCADHARREASGKLFIQGLLSARPRLHCSWKRPPGGGRAQHIGRQGPSSLCLGILAPSGALLFPRIKTFPAICEFLLKFISH